MRTVRVLSAILIALLIAAPLSAQDKEKAKGKRAPSNPTRRAMMTMERLRTAVEGLDLSAEQKEQLDKVHEKVGPKMKEAYTKLQEIFTEEQRNAAGEAMQKARDEGKSGAEAFDAVEAVVKPTDEQKKKMDKVGEEMLGMQKEVLKEVFAVLTPEQRAKVKEKMRPEAKPAKPAEKDAAK